MTVAKIPYQLPEGVKVSPPLCDECRVDTLAVAQVPGKSWWLCAPHLARASAISGA